MTGALHRPTVETALQWLQEALERTDYGEITLRFKMHDGRVARIEHGVAHSIKPAPEEREGG